MLWLASVACDRVNQMMSNITTSSQLTHRLTQVAKGQGPHNQDIPMLLSFFIGHLHAARVLLSG